MCRDLSPPSSIGCLELRSLNVVSSISLQVQWKTLLDEYEKRMDLTVVYVAHLIKILYLIMLTLTELRPNRLP